MPPFGPVVTTFPIGKTCRTFSETGAFPPPTVGTYALSRSCSTRWTYAGGLSPLGQRINFAPHQRLQPFLTGNAGLLAATRDIPAVNSSAFNFTFELGAGIELFQNHRRSWSAVYLLHHLSNAYIGNFNPGVDSQVLALTYTFGR